MRRLEITSWNHQQISHWLDNSSHDSLKACVQASNIPPDFKSALLQDLSITQEPGERRQTETQRMINTLAHQELYGLFKASYFPSLSFDGIKFHQIKIPQYDGLRFDSPVVPVVITDATPGFMDDTVVALFPENHIRGTQHPEDKIFYFINKFVDRHFRKTRPILDKFTANSAFSRIKRLGRAEIEDCAVHWVWLHEYFHRVGPVPVPEYLDIKSYRPLAGLEECRVDMEALCLIRGGGHIPPEKAEMICEFILAERLLRYSVEGIPNPNYDAIGSQVLVNYLKEHGYLWIQSGLMHIANDYIDGLESFVKKIREIESCIHHSPRLVVRSKLIEFVNAGMNIPYESRNYVHDDFFLMVNQQLFGGRACLDFTTS